MMQAAVAGSGLIVDTPESFAPYGGGSDAGGGGGMVYGVTYIGTQPVAAPIAMGPVASTPADGGYDPGPASIRLAPAPVASDVTTPTVAVAVSSGGLPSTEAAPVVGTHWVWLAAAVAAAVLLLKGR